MTWNPSIPGMTKSSDHQIEGLFLYLLDPLLTIRRCGHLVSCTLQQDLAGYLAIAVHPQ